MKFKLQNCDSVGCSRLGTIETSYAEIYQKFGEANRKYSADGKVEKSWCFVSAGGHVVTLYAYKVTPSDNEVYDFSIGARTSEVVKPFIDFFKETPSSFEKVISKEALAESVIREIKKHINDEDEFALLNFLLAVDKNLLIGFLPECDQEQWKQLKED